MFYVTLLFITQKYYITKISRLFLTAKNIYTEIKIDLNLKSYNQLKSS